MFLYVYVDILVLYHKPGVIEDILAGTVWEFQITQTWATVALALMAIPIAMITLSVVLPARTNRVANLVVASLYIPVSAFNAVGESWTYYYAISIGLELAVLAAIVRYAWTWPRTGTATTSRPRDTELRRATV